jgi:hypothetical protein
VAIRNTGVNVYANANMVHLYDIVTDLCIRKIEFQLVFRPFAFHIAFDLELFVTELHRYKGISVCAYRTVYNALK